MKCLDDLDNLQARVDELAALQDGHPGGAERAAAIGAGSGISGGVVNHETHEKGEGHERGERLSWVSHPFALFVFQTALDEQRRIVTYLDGLQAQVDELTALQDATQAELDALLPSVLDRIL